MLLNVLGTEFRGVLGCDYFSAYRKYLRLNENVLVQFCLAHLIRDVRFLVEHPNSKNRAYGQRVLAALRDLFGLIHCRGRGSEAKFRGALEDQGYEVWTQATYRVPPTAEAQNLAERFHQHGREYLRFITTPSVEPTNNLAEQAIRFVVIDRRVTQGSRSLARREWLERIWTAIATCTQHGASVFDYLNQTVWAHFADQPPPALLPGTSRNAVNCERLPQAERALQCRSSLYCPIMKTRRNDRFQHGLVGGRHSHARTREAFDIQEWAEGTC